MSNSIPNTFLARYKSSFYLTSLTWTIDTFSQRSGAWVKSPPFTDEERKDYFYLYLWPNKQEFVKLILFMLGKEEIQVKVKISLINSQGKKCLLYDQTGSLEPSTNALKYVEMSIPKFISRADLLEPSNEYLPSDTMTLHCEIAHLDNEKTTLKASDAETMEKVFNTLRNDYGDLLRSGNLADVKLIVGGQTILAHKLILSARSSVFAARFSHETKEEMENQVEILDINAEAMKMFLEFLYTGAMPTLESIKSAEDLLIVADKYKIEQLKTICEDFIATRQVDQPDSLGYASFCKLS